MLVALLRVPAPVAGEIVQELGLTPLFAGSLLTIAVIVEVPVAATVVGFAEREIVMAGTVMLAVPESAGLVTEVAVIITVKSVGGGVAGAW